MTKNLYLHATDSKSHAGGRGSPDTYAALYGVPFRPEDFASTEFIPISDAATEATIAMHEQLARNWGSWTLFCKQCCDLMRPFYMFQLDMAQQYFSFICGMPQCISEPVGEQLKKYDQEPGPHPRPRLVTRDEREEIAEAFDIAIGATPEVWVDVVKIARAAA